MAGPVLAFIAVAAYAALHSLLASRWAKARARALLGGAAERVYRLIFNVIGAITFLPVLAVLALEPGRRLYAVPWPWSILFVAGQAVAAACVAVGIWQTDALHFLGLRQLMPSDRETPSLVTTGLYRYVRHPLYTAGMAFLWLTPLMTTTLLAVDLALTAYFYLGTFHEEARLRAEFGEAYAEYQRRVPRLIPRLLRPAAD
ncbi:MAG TPA: isoprenylcysteine carboxylmethyltransferase family protein [Anaerolineales bacterium]|nr:isoprenylcysteine carboxylmethyltransferase family protein [Anaerolineales bacterium]